MEMHFKPMKYYDLFIYIFGSETVIVCKFVINPIDYITIPSLTILENKAFENNSETGEILLISISSFFPTMFSTLLWTNLRHLNDLQFVVCRYFSSWFGPRFCQSESKIYWKLLFRLFKVSSK